MKEISVLADDGATAAVVRHDAAGRVHPRSRANGQRLRRVLAYMEENLESPIDLDELASVACLSRFHFARVFKAAMGKAPCQYVAGLRMERAKLLLARGDRSLLDIALALDFSSQASFTRAFREATGQTPGAFAGRPAGARDARIAVQRQQSAHTCLEGNNERMRL